MPGLTQPWAHSVGRLDSALSPQCGKAWQLGNVKTRSIICMNKWIQLCNYILTSVPSTCQGHLSNFIVIHLSFVLSQASRHPPHIHSFTCRVWFCDIHTDIKSLTHTDTSGDIMHPVEHTYTDTYFDISSYVSRCPICTAIYTASWHTECPKISIENWWGSNMA
jgi:hypothetical protein